MLILLFFLENYTERTAAADEGSSKQKVQPKPVALFRMVANIKMQGRLLLMLNFL